MELTIQECTRLDKIKRQSYFDGNYECIICLLNGLIKSKDKGTVSEDVFMACLSKKCHAPA